MDFKIQFTSKETTPCAVFYCLKKSFGMKEREWFTMIFDKYKQLYSEPFLVSNDNFGLKQIVISKNFGFDD
jgi:hypothetical protein